MTTIESRPLARTGLTVSSLAFGTVPLSGFGVATTYQDFET